MKQIFRIFALMISLISAAHADQVLIIDSGYANVTANVQGRLEAAGHTVTVTSSVASIPTTTATYQQVWDLRYSAALTAGETTSYTTYITNGGFAYFVTENPGCCMSRNNSIAALITGLGGGTTQIGPGWADNVNTNVNTTYMTNGITVNYMAVAAIVNSQGIPLIQDANGNVSGMSWIGRAGALGQGVLGTIITVADTNWLAQAWGSDNQTALDDIIRGIVAGTVAGTVSASGNGAGATNGNTGSSTPTIVSSAAGPDAVTTTVSLGASTVTVSQAAPSVTTSSGIQTVRAGNITTRTSTPQTTRTCTVPSTVNTWSDGSTTVDLGTQTCSDSTVNLVNSVTQADAARTQGRYDQFNQLYQADRLLRRTLDHDMFARNWMTIDKDTRISVSYQTGTGSAAYGTDLSNRGYGAALDRAVSGTLRVGLQANNIDTSMIATNSSISQTKTHLGAFGRFKLDDRTYLHTGVNMAWNDISYTRTMPIMVTALGTQYVIGNHADVKSTDFWLTNRVSHEVQPGVNIYGGLCSGMVRRQAFAETGTSLTALTWTYGRYGESAALSGIDVQKKLAGLNLRGAVELDTSGFAQYKVGLDILSRKHGALSVSYTRNQFHDTTSDVVMIGGRLSL